MLRSTDGGQTFAAGPSLPESASSLWLDPDDQLALIATDTGSIYRSTDSGQRFTRVFQDPTLIHLILGGGDGTYLSATALHPVATEDGPYALGCLLSSDDAGATFSSTCTEVLHPGARARLPVSTGSATHTLWVGEHLHGLVQRGAFDLTLIQTDRPLGPQEVSFGAPRLGFVLATARHPNPPGVISAVFRVDESGVTRILQTPDPAPLSALHGLFAVDADHVFLRGETSRAAPGTERMLRSLDGGATWTQQAPFSFTALAFGSAALGLRLDGAALSRTTDGTASFTPIALPGSSTPRALSFADADHAVVVGDDGAIFTSADGGQTFSPQRKGPVGQTLRAVAFQPGGPTGWAVGDQAGRAVLLKTTDAGATWTEPPLPDGVLRLHRIAAGSGARAWALGEDAAGEPLWLFTLDGARWQRRAAVAPDLTAVDGGARGSAQVLGPAGPWTYAISPTGLYVDAWPGR